MILVVPVDCSVNGACLKALMQDLLMEAGQDAPKFLLMRAAPKSIHPAVLVNADEFESWKETLGIKSDPDLMKEIKKGLSALKKKSKLYTLEERVSCTCRFLPSHIISQEHRRMRQTGPEECIRRLSEKSGRR